LTNSKKSDIVKKLEVEMANKNRCCDIRGCPASYYLSCEAYKAEKNCFEVKAELPCCRHDKSCEECDIYKKLAINE
jgi:hypothetical protein